MGIKCCIDCKKRFPACHDSCKDYRDEKEKDKEIKLKIQQEKKIDMFEVDMTIERRKKWRKQK